MRADYIKIIASTSIPFKRAFKSLSYKPNYVKITFQWKENTKETMEVFEGGRLINGRNDEITFK